MDNGNERLLNTVEKVSLRCASTYFQPPHKRTNATFMNIQPEKAPSQIDYDLVSSRWYSAIRNCKTMWDISISAYGRKYDHALIKFKFQIHLKCDRRSKRKDFKALKQPDTAGLYNDIINRDLNSSELPPNVSTQFKRLTETMISAQEGLPNNHQQRVRPLNVTYL